MVSLIKTRYLHSTCCDISNGVLLPRCYFTTAEFLQLMFAGSSLFFWGWLCICELCSLPGSTCPQKIELGLTYICNNVKLSVFLCIWITNVSLFIRKEWKTCCQLCCDHTYLDHWLGHKFFWLKLFVKMKKSLIILLFCMCVSFIFVSFQCDGN